MRLETAKSAGFCFGVNRAVDMAFKAAEEKAPMCIMGELIHNPTVCEDLKNKGVRTISSIEEVKEGETVLIRAHGEPKNVFDYLEKYNIPYVDTTCPFVQRIYKIVAEEAKDRVVLISGDEKHPEVKGIIGHSKNPTYCFKSCDELDELLAKEDNFQQKEVVMVSQTTFNIEENQKCQKKLKKLCTNVKIFDTICKATAIRQKEADELSRRADAMIVIGGANSSNTQKLFGICKGNCKSIMIQYASQLDDFKKSLSADSFIGITAGASTPDCIIKEVQESMSNLDNISNDMSFEEMLNESFKSTYNGETVTGVVTGVKPNEISVDIGTKHAGYVPLHELTDDPTAKADDLVKVGDELKLLVVRINDVEGTVMLSKKRLDAAEGFEKVMAAGETGEILKGNVTEVIKGGVLVLSNGVKVFVPASQTGIPKSGDLNTLLRKEVSFKILETNRQRRRALGSISAVLREERAALAAKFWDEVEVDKEYTGVVKSITNFGVFVDLGGVDGRIGLSDLTWLRVKHPSEVVKVGETVTVTVKDINKEDKKVSLIYKKAEDNPWEKIKTMYAVGDVVKVKIMSITAFGAFAEIIPGIDGLIHISQIAKERVEKVSDKLAVGQEVEAKITELDFDKKRASLSMKALLADEAPAEEAADAEA